MRYQIQNSKETNTVELKCTDLDGAVDKTKLNIYEDGTDEEFLKLLKEFHNYVSTYEIWNDEHASHTIYKSFRRCLAGAARDLWDQINVLDDEEERDELSFEIHIRELTSAILGDDAYMNQKDYLKTTLKPEKMTVKQWINRLKNINSYLPLMQADAQALSETDLMAEVITKNIPAEWVKDFKSAKLHLKTRIKDIMSELTIIEEQVKTHRKEQNGQNKKNLKSPCRVHNGHHEWDDCHENPKNKKSSEHTHKDPDKNRHFGNNGKDGKR
jgi:hypothetical protein